jgi:asparagine synthase (glutamine-hydrolysing)
MWDKRFERFPEHTPINKEYYLLREIFEEYYPKKCALDTIPKGLSVACSTPEAISWDPTWENMHDISGRVVAFHSAADEYVRATEMSVDFPVESVAAKATSARTAQVVQVAHSPVDVAARRGCLSFAGPRLPRMPRQRVRSSRMRVSH